MSAASALSVGDIYGFAALFLIALAASLMLLRPFILKVTKNIAMIRAVHLAVSTMAGFFLTLHISTLFMLPTTTGVALGYAAVLISVSAWLTGTAFLKKVKDSLFFHGVLSSILIPLSIIHAATASVNISGLLSELLLVGSAGVVLANGALHVKRAMGAMPKSTPVKPATAGPAPPPRTPTARAPPPPQTTPAGPPAQSMAPGAVPSERQGTGA